jgi:hypothetical protein
VTCQRRKGEGGVGLGGRWPCFAWYFNCFADKKNSSGAGFHVKQAGTTFARYVSERMAHRSKTSDKSKQTATAKPCRASRQRKPKTHSPLHHQNEKAHPLTKVADLQQRERQALHVDRASTHRQRSVRGLLCRGNDRTGYQAEAAATDGVAQWLMKGLTPT